MENCLRGRSSDVLAAPRRVSPRGNQQAGQKQAPVQQGETHFCRPFLAAARDDDVVSASGVFLGDGLSETGSGTGDEDGSGHALKIRREFQVSGFKFQDRGSPIEKVSSDQRDRSLFGNDLACVVRSFHRPRERGSGSRCAFHGAIPAILDRKSVV